jgi:tRNA(Ile)-lysidine synthetase-like protein
MIKIIKQILPKEAHYHMAVSMGIDSVAALFWLRSKGYQVTPMHFNHNLRAQNGTMQDKFLELCSKLGLEGKTEIGVGLKTEAECRNARLNFYSKVAKNGTIITAHHLNDWVESYLLNCLRGHPHHRPFELVSQFPDFKVAHPFLLTKKQDFRQFLERNGWMEHVVQDESNSVIKGSRRNWVRNSIIPQMTSQKLSLEKFAKRKIEKLAQQGASHG